MAARLVFSGNLDPANPNLSSRFSEATSFFIEAPMLNAELEINVYLQVYLPGIVGETVRVLPLGKIEEQAIRLNLTDTETLESIPLEFQNTGLQMALLFIASDTTFLYATMIIPDCNLCAIDDRLNVIEDKIDLILANLNIPAPVVPATATTNSISQLQFLGII